MRGHSKRGSSDKFRHCGERSDEAIYKPLIWKQSGQIRYACHDASSRPSAQQHRQNDNVPATMDWNKATSSRAAARPQRCRSGCRSGASPTHVPAPRWTTTAAATGQRRRSVHHRNRPLAINRVPPATVCMVNGSPKKTTLRNAANRICEYRNGESVEAGA